jgi:hypothetical protein
MVANFMVHHENILEEAGVSEAENNIWAFFNQDVAKKLRTPISFLCRIDFDPTLYEHRSWVDRKNGSSELYDIVHACTIEPEE